MKHIIAAIALLFLIYQPAQADDPIKAADTVLTNFHQAASEAAWDKYFSLLTDDSIFIGTDVGERWDKPTFRGYASKTKGWTYTKRERHIDISTDGNTAWFDEILDNLNYGTSRGTGVMIRTNNGWKIIQYHLTFPIPNDLAAGITQEIQTFEARKKAKQ